MEIHLYFGVIMSGNYEQLAETLARLDVDWKAREEGLSRLQTRLEEGRSDAFDFLNGRGAKLLALQLSDLRSGVVRGAAEAIQAACQARMESKQLSLDTFAENLLKEHNTFKAVGSGNKLIASYAARALLCLFEARTVPFGALEGLLNVARGNKNPQIREKIAHCLSIYAAHPSLSASRRSKPTEMADFFLRAGELFMKDATANVRNFAKKIKGFIVLSDDATYFGDQSKDTADELEPPRFKKYKPKGVHPCTEVLTVERFKKFVEEIERGRDSQQRENAKSILSKAEFKPLMPELLKVAAILDIPLRSHLSFLISPLLKCISTPECFDLYLNESSLSSLLFLKHQLLNNREKLPPSLYQKIIDVLCRRLACRPSSLPLLQGQAETLSLVLKHSGEVKLDISGANFSKALQIMQEMNLEVPPSLIISQAVEGKNLMMPAEIKEVQPSLKERPAFKSMQPIKLSEKIISENDIINSGRDNIDKTVKDKNDVDFFLSLNELFSAFCKCNREAREKICEDIISLYEPSAFYEFIETQLVEHQETFGVLVDAMKLALCVFKQVLTKKEAKKFVSEAVSVLPSFVAVIKTYVFSHSEVVVRKTTVQLLVSLYHLVGETIFEQVLTYFSPEQQRLIQVYIKKSFE